MDPTKGELFSRNYLKPKDLAPDSARMRFRVSAFLIEYLGDASVEVGRIVEKELGVPMVQYYSGSYVPWEQLLKDCDTVDFLDIITVIARKFPYRTKVNNGIRFQSSLINFVEKVFRDQHIAYSIDEKGGIHPFVDSVFTSETSETISHLSGAELNAAKQLVERAEKCLLDSSYDGRGTIRAIFDAVENIFKLLCPKCNQLNKAGIVESLRPVLLEPFIVGSHEHRAAAKLVESLHDWVEAGHNFRHETGQVEVSQPSLQIATQYLSQGMGYVRWLCHSYANRPNP